LVVSDTRRREREELYRNMKATGVLLNQKAVRRILAIEGQKWTNRAKISFIRGLSLVRMKKIEAIIDPAALEAVKLHLAEAGIDGRLTMTEVSGLEDLGRFYQMETTGQNPWRACLRIDLIVSDRQTQSTVNIILQHANLASRPGTGGHINILSLDATLEINAEALCQPSKEKKEPKKTITVANGVPPAIAPEASESSEI
jgi:nitrogen regulatory protein PII